ncbi:MAG: signal peptidase I [bacterium]|nr:signal peptidase I [bacterium]
MPAPTMSRSDRKAAPPPAPSTPPAKSPGARVRELADELVLVFLLVMFVKMFFVELYKIPSGSMTPTLLGGTVAFVDLNGDGHKDLVYWEDATQPLAFVNDPVTGRYLANRTIQARFDAGNLPFIPDRLKHNVFDRILVDKMAYWLRNPRRGEIVIFKVPARIFKPEAPIYVKRLVGEPGDLVTFDTEGRLVVDNRPVDRPAFFRTQRYKTTIFTRTDGYDDQPNVVYNTLDAFDRRILAIKVPPDKAYVFGDNTAGSLDSRYWGGVPLPNFKGRAFLRVLPLGRFGFLD